MQLELTWIYNVLKHNFQIKEINTKERVIFQNEGNQRESAIIYNNILLSESKKYTRHQLVPKDLIT